MATLHMVVMSIQYQYVAPEKDGVLLQEEKRVGSRFSLPRRITCLLP